MIIISVLITHMNLKQIAVRFLIYSEMGFFVTFWLFSCPYKVEKVCDWMLLKQLNMHTA